MLACAAAVSAFYAPTPLRAGRGAIRCCDMPSDSYDDTEDAVEVPSASDLTDPPEKSALLAALDGIDRGFAATSSQRKAVTSALEALKAVNPRPTDGAIGLSGDWELLYTDAPDILGLKNAGPLAELRRVGQQIDAEAGTIENVIEYEPREWATSLFSNLKGDRLQQRVVTSFARREGAPATVDLKIRGVRLLPRQALGVSLESAPPLQLLGPLAEHQDALFEFVALVEESLVQEREPLALRVVGQAERRHERLVDCWEIALVNGFSSVQSSRVSRQ